MLCINLENQRMTGLKDLKENRIVCENYSFPFQNPLYPTDQDD